MAALYLITHVDPTARQVFAIGAIFGYSINIFSATAGHEMLHQTSRPARACSDVLYAAMLYPHLLTVHISSHHRWAGSGQDCQNPSTWTANLFLPRSSPRRRTKDRAGTQATLDPRLYCRVGAVALGVVTLCLLATWQALMFFIVQGLFSFILIETLNYVQHYKPTKLHANAAAEEPQFANQDLNFISRCLLFNLPLHASHHADHSLHCTVLAPVPGAPSYCLGYWTSFWLAWTPPLWIRLNRLGA